MSTLKARNAHKGRTFGGVAACPHCSSPIRVFVTAARVQCVLDVVACSYSIPTQLPDGDAVELDRSHGVLAVSARAVGPDHLDTATGGGDAPTTGVNVPAAVQADLFPQRGGFDDDEAPFPP